MVTGTSTGTLARTRRRPRVRVLVAAAWLFWVVSVGWFLLRQWREFTPDSYVDLRVYRAGVQAWLTGSPVYDATLVREGLLFTYPPVALMVLAPLAWPPFPLAAVLLVAINVLLVYGVCLVLVRVSGLRITGRGPGLDAAVLLAPALWLEPVRNTFDYGQVNLLLLALVTVDLLLVPARWRGVLTGVAAAVKVTPAFFLLWCVATRAWRSAALLVGTAAAATVLGVLLLPGASVEFWTQRLFQADRVGKLEFTGNQSLLGAAVRLVGEGAAARLCWLALAAAVVALAYVVVRRSYEHGLRVTPLAVTGLAGLLVAPISWSHHWVWVLPLAIAGWTELRDRAARVAVGALTVACFAAPQWYLPRDDGRELGWSWWQWLAGDAYVLLGLAVLVALAAASDRRPSRGAAAARAPRSRR